MDEAKIRAQVWEEAAKMALEQVAVIRNDSTREHLASRTTCENLAGKFYEKASETMREEFSFQWQGKTTAE